MKQLEHLMTATYAMGCLLSPPMNPVGQLLVGWVAVRWLVVEWVDFLLMIAV
jgi:hypothetical protein